MSTTKCEPGREVTSSFRQKTRLDARSSFHVQDNSQTSTTMVITTSALSVARAPDPDSLKLHTCGENPIEQCECLQQIFTCDSPLSFSPPPHHDAKTLLREQFSIPDSVLITVSDQGAENTENIWAWAMLLSYVDDMLGSP